LEHLEDSPLNSLLVQPSPLVLTDRRTVAAVIDAGRWVFERSDSPFPFDGLSHFDAQRKRDRFTKEMLAVYLDCLEARPLSDETLRFGSACREILLERQARSHLQEYTLEKAKALSKYRSLE